MTSSPTDVRPVARREDPDPQVRVTTDVVRRATRLVAALAVVGGVLREVAVHVIGVDGPLGELRPLSLDAEASLPTWIATLLLAGAALAWAVPGLARRRTGRGRVALGVAAVLLLASVDEGASMHETLIEPLRDGLGLGGVLRFGWVVVGIPVVAVLVVALLRVRDRLPEPVARELLVGLLVFVGGAVGMELVGGAVDEALGRDSWAWSVSVVVEEALELLGTVLALSAGLRLWRLEAPRVVVRAGVSP